MTTFSNDDYTAADVTGGIDDIHGEDIPKLEEPEIDTQIIPTTNGKAKKKDQTKTNEKKQKKIDVDQLLYKTEVLKLQKDNLDISFEYWSTTLLEKRKIFNTKLTENFPDLELLGDFELAIKTILNVQDITLPFMGIALVVPSSLKTALIERLRKLPYSYFTDKFNARSFVSHNANTTEEKLEKEIDILPAVRDKIFLTPELATLFTQKDDDIKEQFGLITRVLDGHGLETNSGVHGKRGYHGTYMFTWLAAAVEIPHNIYRFLSTIGFKIYFLRLPKIKVTVNDLVAQLSSEMDFNQKMDELDKILSDYLMWFEVCPIAIGQQNITPNNDMTPVKIEWDKKKDDKNSIKIIGELALLLSHIRGSVYVYRNSEHDELIPVGNTESGDGAYAHGVAIIERPYRANQQLYNLARGHALSYGRNYITEEDLPLVTKVVLSTGSIERVLILDLLIANKGTLTTSQIKQSMNLGNNAAKRTMTEFKGLELVTMDRTNGDTSNSEHKIVLKPEFDWFLTPEFEKLRDDYTNKIAEFAMRKNTPVRVQQKLDESNPDDDITTTTPIKTDNAHGGENAHSKTETVRGYQMSPDGEIHEGKPPW